MSMKKIKKDDQVIILTGRDRTKTGRVLRVNANKKVVVEGLHMLTKHTKPNPQKNVQGGIVKIEAAIAISNVAILNPRTKKADRVGFKVLDDGRKVRYFKSDNEVID